MGETSALERTTGGTPSGRIVYFIAAENGLVKIGFASNWLDRLGKLCCGSPVPLTPLALIAGGRTEERDYHERFSAWRRHGEWFELTDEMEAEIDRINYAQAPQHIPIRHRGHALPLTLTRKVSRRWQRM